MVVSTELPAEVWRLIPGWENTHKVSNLGRVMRTHSPAGVPCERILKGWYNKGGYNRVSLRGNGRRHDRYVHILVLTAHIQPRPFPEWEACHGDGKPANNVITNLRWDNREGNYQDRVKHGTSGEKLSCYQRDAIGRSEEPARNLAAEYDVSETTIRRVRKRYQRTPKIL